MTFTGSDSMDQENGKFESFLMKAIRITVVEALYWFISITMVLLNKYLLDSPALKLGAPLSVIFYQCFVTVILCWCLSVFARLCPGYVQFPSVRFDPKISRGVLPLSIVPPLHCLAYSWLF